MAERYPSEIELREIRKWKGSFRDLMNFIHEIWAYREWGWRQKGKTYWISTAGWSGNEEIIEAMKENKNYFWIECWYQTRRGGHYFFKIREWFKGNK